MARQPRIWLPGSGAHTICRFIDRRFYLTDDVSRRALMSAIDRANERWDWHWLSYAVMSSHLHYGHIAGNVEPERFFRSAHTRLAQHLHGHTDGQTLGHVFANRPTIHVVGQAGLARLVAYHHRNPVKAGVVDRCSESTWTSHRAYLRLDPAPAWLNVERGLAALGFSDTAAGRKHFDEFVTEVNLDEAPAALRPSRAVRPTHDELADCDWLGLVEAARLVAGLAPSVLLQAKHQGSEARQLIALVATRDFRQSHAFVAARLEMTPGSVSRIVNRRLSAVRLEQLAALRRNVRPLMGRWDGRHQSRTPG